MAMLSVVYRYLQSLDPMVVSSISLVLFFSTILYFFYLWGEAGLYLYIAVAIIGANFQVIKVSNFSLLGEVALGTVLFSSTYLCTDILSEHYGPRSARRGIFIGFAALLFWTLITQLTLAFSPLSPESTRSEYYWALPVHQQMESIFKVVPSFFIAGVSAYLISQLNDVFLYNFIKRKTGNRFVWLRNNLSTMISALIDNTVFSLIAFWWLAENQIGFKNLIFTYILGTYLIRVAVALLDTPFIYLTKYIKPRSRPQA